MGNAENVDLTELKGRMTRRLFVLQVLLLGLLLGLVIYNLSSAGRLGSSPLSLMVGALGGSLAMLRNLPGMGEADLRLAVSSWVGVLMPALYGAFLAGVAYLLFMSGILSGACGDGLIATNLFPAFDRPKVGDGGLLDMQTAFGLRPASVTDLGKLFVWCFVAGYSEHFVVGILGKLERQGSG